MTVLPVIIRELQEEARRPFNYWLRVLAAAALVGIFTMMVWGRQWGPTTSGAELFGNLNATLFAAIWILVPLLTADCISAERREGTLGLLFLTPLTAVTRRPSYVFASTPTASTAPPSRPSDGND